MPTQNGEKKMKRNANLFDVPKALLTTMPKFSKRYIREPKKGQKEIVEIRLANVCLYFQGIHLACFTHIYPGEINNENVPLVHEMYARNSMIGEEVATYLEKNEVPFLGDKFARVGAKEFNSALHREIGNWGQGYLVRQVDRLLNIEQKKGE